MKKSIWKVLSLMLVFFLANSLFPCNPVSGASRDKGILRVLARDTDGNPLNAPFTFSGFSDKYETGSTGGKSYSISLNVKYTIKFGSVSGYTIVQPPKGIKPIKITKAGQMVTVKAVYKKSSSGGGGTTGGGVAGPTVTDIEGNVYNSVIIGAQTWMKENLKVTRYRDGAAIPTTTATPEDLDISGETSPAYQWAYNGDEANVAVYGRLYTWHAATDSRGLCPSGWHLPTDAEWTTLTDYLGGESVAGGKMKEAGTTHWYSPNTGADNSSGFTALPGGYSSGTFSFIGDYGVWWSATESSSASAWGRLLAYDGGDVYRDYYDKYIGLSVRCVGD